jgi:hypothetical protein
VARIARIGDLFALEEGFGRVSSMR